MSKKYNHEIGYEALLADFRRYQKQCPKGISMTRKEQTISLQFKVGNKSRSQYGCNCSFTLDGMVEALSKAKKVSEALKSFTSEIEFWQWYDREIREINKISNDVLTFGEAIALVEDNFWSRMSRTKRKRDKNDPSDLSSWGRAYEGFYKLLPFDKAINVVDILAVINKQKKGTKNYQEVIRAMKKLVETVKRQDVHEVLSSLDTTQTEFADLQSIDLDEFLAWKDKTLGLTASLPDGASLDTRQCWLWVFSMQIVYGLRISEVFAIQNLEDSYQVSKKETIPAYNHPDNPFHLIYVGEKTIFGTTVKTGKRVARLLIPPSYPNIVEKLDLLNPKVPVNRPKSSNPKSISTFVARTARQLLIEWNAPFTQTHADRHLANIHGMQAGIPLEVRAQSLGHTPAVNDRIYKKRQKLQTTIDLLTNSNTQAIDFVTALNDAKKLVTDYPDSKPIIAKLIAIIYGKNSEDIMKLL